MSHPAEQTTSIVNYKALRARKAWLGRKNKDLVKATKMSSQTVTAFLAGAETLNLKTIKKLASELGLEVIVDFRVIDEESK